MSLSTLFQTAWAVYRRSRLIWIFALIAFAISAVGLFLSTGASQVLLLVKVILVWLIGLYAETGTIYSAGSALEYQPATFEDAQRVLGKNALRLVVIGLITPVIVSLLPALVITTIIQLQSGQPTLSFLGSYMALINVVFFLIAALLYPFVFYSFSGVIIHSGSLGGSMRRGWRIYRRNLGVSLRVALVFFAAWLVVRAGASGISLLFPGDHTMAQIFGQDALGGILFLLLSTTGQIADLVFFSLLLDPLKRIMLANVYLQALGEIPSPAQSRVEIAPAEG